MKTTETDFVVDSIELSGRIRLQYVERGDAAGTPVIFLHGITDSWRSFEPVLPHLPESIHAFAVTQRGHGDSDHPASSYHPREFAADIAAFMDTLGLERAVIAGHSMGSHMAKRFALDYPDRVLGLVLMGTFLSLRGNQGVTELREAVMDLTDPVDYNFALEFQQSTIARAVPERFLDLVTRESLKAPARVWRAALEGITEDDHTAELHRIEVPALIVWGDKDAFCPEGDQVALRSIIAGSRLVVYHGTGHALHWEEPERFATDLTTFIAKLER